VLFTLLLILTAKLRACLPPVSHRGHVIRSDRPLGRWSGV